MVRAWPPNREPPATPRLKAEALIAVTRVGASGAAARAVSRVHSQARRGKQG
ncbi:hypothetical protein [Microbispora siamensis]|uniref:hypothetical protein n=1 Tax=Microbispora siamensis TaxID=564413 RepID=UPI0019511456|nr:hypothetical protein [Microbispora siamensis]